jgi:hypothetical protein
MQGGDAFVLQWSAIPPKSPAGHHRNTLLTVMFMHGGWLRIPAM